MNHINKGILSAECPVPKLDFEFITLGHGSGGLLTNKLLESGVFTILKNDLLNQKHDGTVFQAEGKMSFTTDSFVVSPIFFPGGNIGELAVNGTVNDLAMCGSRAQYLSLSFIIEEGLSMEDFWEILLSVQKAAEKAGVQIITGDTKVVEKGKGDKLFINTSGIGLVYENMDIGLSRVVAGDKIIASGPIAAHGMAIMSVRQGLEFESSIVSDTCHFNDIVRDIASRFGSKIHLLRDATRGGIASVLNEVARDTQLGMEIFEKDIPVFENVAGACELLGMDPLYVANEGVFVAFVAEEIADETVKLLRTWENGNHASVIGFVTPQHPKQVIHNSIIGGKRVVNMLTGEQLPRIC